MNSYFLGEETVRGAALTYEETIVTSSVEGKMFGIGAI